MCSHSTARKTLYCINITFFLVGIAMLGLGIYSLTIADELGHNLVPTIMIRLLIIAGATVTVTSFLGCCGAKKHPRAGFWRYVLLLYSTIVLCAIILQAVVIAFTLTWLSRLDDVKEDDGGRDQGATEWEQSFNDATNQTYVTCCVQDTSSKLCHWVDTHTANGCDGSYPAFRHKLAGAIEDRLKILATLSFIFAIIEVICLFTACGLFWSKPHEAEGPRAYGTNYEARAA